MRFVFVVTLVAAAASIAHADSDRAGSSDSSVLGSPSSRVAPIVEGGGLAGPSQGQALELTSEAREGVATYVGARWDLIGHEGRSELVMTAAVEKHVGAVLVHLEAAFAREIERDQRDAQFQLSALRPVASRVALGLAGQGVLDLDDGRDDGGEVRWEMRGGAAARVRLGGDTRTLAGHCALSLDAGADALATPTSAGAGPFLLAAVGGWF